MSVELLEDRLTDMSFITPQKPNHPLPIPLMLHLRGPLLAEAMRRDTSRTFKDRVKRMRQRTKELARQHATLLIFGTK
ncbi:MAG: hypothetical protein WCN98_13070 [Verrucomicrobiaceae bacterium]